MIKMEGCECCKGSCKDIRVYFCPECKSRNVGYTFGLGNLFGVIPKMKCDDCGFEDSGFPILVIGEDDLKKAVSGEAGVKKKVVKKKKKKKTVKKKTARRNKK